MLLVLRCLYEEALLPPLPLLATLLEVWLPKVLFYNLSLGEDDNTDVLTTYDGHFVNVTLTAGTLSSGINAFALNFGDGETVTGIVKIDNGNLKDDSFRDGWFMLDGRKLPGKPTQKGIYINNGRKVVIK